MTTTRTRRHFREPAATGTVARSAIEHLQTLPPGTELPSAVLAAACGQPGPGFSSFLRPAAKAGLLDMRMQGNFALWSLGPNINRDKPPRAPTPWEEESEPPRFVDATAANSIFAYAKERGAAPFSTALSSDGRLTIERHGRVVLELTDQERRALLKTAEQGVVPC